MTPVSITIARHKWWQQTENRNSSTYLHWWKTVRIRLARYVTFKRKPAARRTLRYGSLDQLSDHELRDIGLTRDKFGYQSYHCSDRALRDLRYDRLRRLPGE